MALLNSKEHEWSVSDDEAVELTKYVMLLWDSLLSQLPKAFMKYYSKSSHHAVL